MNEAIDPQTQTMIDNMPEKTGRSLAEWSVILAASGAQKHGEFMKLLKGEYGVTHGYANTISILYRQGLAGGPAAADDLVAAQYEGGKAALKPIYDTVISTVTSFGPDVDVAPKKSYVSLRRSKQFAIVKAATTSRVDLGLNLKGVEGTARFEAGNAFGGMCTHLVKLTSAADVDDELKEWLKRAFDQA